MSAADPAGLSYGDWVLSRFMKAYTALKQDSNILLDKRRRTFVPPAAIIPGDLVRDQGRFKQVERVSEEDSEASTYVYFIDATPGFKRLQYPGRPDAVVWRLESAFSDDAAEQGGAS